MAKKQKIQTDCSFGADPEAIAIDSRGNKINPWSSRGDAYDIITPYTKYTQVISRDLGYDFLMELRPIPQTSAENLFKMIRHSMFVILNHPRISDLISGAKPFGYSAGFHFHVKPPVKFTKTQIRMFAQKLYKICDYFMAPIGLAITSKSFERRTTSGYGSNFGRLATEGNTRRMKSALGTVEYRPLPSFLSDMQVTRAMCHLFEICVGLAIESYSVGTIGQLNSEADAYRLAKARLGELKQFLTEGQQKILSILFLLVKEKKKCRDNAKDTWGKYFAKAFKTTQPQLPKIPKIKWEKYVHQQSQRKVIHAGKLTVHHRDFGAEKMIHFVRQKSYRVQKPIQDFLYLIQDKIFQYGLSSERGTKTVAVNRYVSDFAKAKMEEEFGVTIVSDVGYGRWANDDTHIAIGLSADLRNPANKEDCLVGANAFFATLLFVIGILKF